jgi:hypothetical protein
VAAPIDAAVSANILSGDSQSTAIAQQDAILTQSITGLAQATSDQVSDINQASIEPPDTDTASADDSASTPATGAPEPDTSQVSVEPAGTDQVTVEPPAADTDTASADDSASTPEAVTSESTGEVPSTDDLTTETSTETTQQ